MIFSNMGIRFNQHWGYQTNSDGKKEILNERLNFYSKPQFTLKDFWTVNDKLSISNIAYVSVGRGGGTSIFNSSALLRDSTGLINWDLVIKENQVNSLFGTPNTDPIYHPTEIKSSQILLASINNHFWAGYLSQFNYTYSKKLEFSGGIDFRYYQGSHYQVITNLLGGDYFVSTADKNDADPMQRVGDKIAKNAFNADRDGIVQWTGAFGQMEYTGKKVSYFVNVSGILNGYKGVDRFQKRVLDLGDTVLRIGAFDTIHRNSRMSLIITQTVSSVKSSMKRFYQRKVDTIMRKRNLDSISMRMLPTGKTNLFHMELLFLIQMIQQNLSVSTLMEWMLFTWEVNSMLRSNFLKNYLEISWCRSDNGIGILPKQCLSLSTIHWNSVSMLKEFM